MEVGTRTHYSSKLVFHNTVLLQIISFSNKDSAHLINLERKQLISFLINIEIKRIMYLNACMYNYAIFQDHKVQKCSNS
jgi:hypothetical protein